VAHNLPRLFVKDLVAVQFTMTSAGGSSRLLVVCCCVSFVSVFLYCIGYVRLEVQIRAYKERLEALEHQEKQLVLTPVPSVPTNGECILKVWFLCRTHYGMITLCRTCFLESP